MPKDERENLIHGRNFSKARAVSLPRYAARRDDNEKIIVDGLEAIGAQVERISKPCDLIVRFRGQVHLLEVDNPKSKYRVREQAQLDFLRAWQVPLVQSFDDALRAIGASRVE